MKTATDLDVISHTLVAMEDHHRFHSDTTAKCYVDKCKSAVCLKCGYIIYSCQPEWAERQCPCDTPSFDKVWNAYEELVKEQQS